MSEYMVEVGLNLQADNYITSMGQAINLTKQYADVASGIPGAVQTLSQSMVKATSAVTGFNKMQTTAIDTAAAYEKQLSNVESKAVLTGQSFDKLAKTTKGWAREFPIGMGEATKVMETLQNQGIKSEKALTTLGKSMIKLGAATNSAPAAMGEQFLQLTKTMGNGLGQFEKLSDSLVTVTAKMGGSAAGVVAFSKAIAPVAATVGLSQTAVMGLSTSLSKMGEDGGYAASSLNKVMLDMTRTIRDGGPELKAYADLMGMTVSQLQQLQKTDPAAVISRFTDSVAKAGPDVTRSLEALGFDSVRTTRSLAALSRSGGVDQAIAESIDAYGNGNTGKAAAVALDGLSDSAEKLRETMGQVVQDVGQPMIGLAKGLLAPVNMVASGAQAVTSSGPGQAVLGAGGVGGFFAGIGGNIIAAATVVKLGEMVYNGVVKPKIVSPYQAGMQAARAGMAAPGGALSTLGYARGAGAASLLGPSSLVTSQSTAISNLGKAATSLGRFATEGFARYQAATANFLGGGPRLGVTPLMQEQRGVMGGALRGMWAAAGAGDATGLRDSTRTLATTLRDYAKGYGQAQGGAPGSLARGIATTAMLPVRGAAALGSVGLRAAGGLMSGLSAAGINPAMLGLIGVAAGGMYAYDQKKKTDARIEMVGDSRSDIYSRFNDFYEAMGKAGKGVVSMSDAVDRTTKILLESNKTWEDTFDVTGKEIAQARSVGYNPDLPFFGDEKTVESLTFQAQSVLGANATMEDVNKALLDVANITNGNVQLIQGVSDNLMKIYGPQGVSTGAAFSAVDFLKALNQNGGLIGAPFTEAQAELATTGATAINRQAYEAGQLFGGTITEGDTTVNAQQATQLLLAEEVFRTAQKNALYLDEGTRVGTEELIAATLGLSDSQKETFKRNKPFNPGSTGYDYFAFLQDVGMADEYGAAQRGGVSRLPNGSIQYGRQLTGELPENVKASMNYLTSVSNAAGATAEWTATVDGLSESLFSVNKVAKETGLQLGDMTKGISTFAGGDFDMISAVQNSADPVAAQKAVESLLTRLSESGASTADQQFALGLAGAESVVGSTERNIFAQAAEQLVANRAVASAGKTQGAQILDQMNTARQAMNTPVNSNSQALVTSQIQQGQMAQAAGLEFMANFNRGFGALQTNIAATRRSAGVSIAGVRAQAALATEQAQEDYDIQDRYARQDYRRQRRYARRDFNTQQRYALEDYNITTARAERDYGIQRGRAERDFNKQIQRSEEDYLRDRGRAFADFGVQRERATRDYNLSVFRAQRDFEKNSTRSEDDFYKSRRRTLEDFNKQMARSAEDGARQMYDPFKRIQAAMVMDAGQLLSNLKDQQRALDKQVGDLAQARAMGVTDETIKALGLADAQNAQQLSRLVGDLAGNADFAAQLNDAVAGKANSAKALFEDQGNVAFSRAQEDMATQLARMDEDFATSQQRARDDFATSMSDAATDFTTAMGDAQADFNKSMSRMNDDYSLSIARARDDFRQSMTDMADDYKRGMSDMAEDFARQAKRASDEFEKQMRRMEAEFDRSRDRALAALELAQKRIADGAALQIKQIGAGAGAAITSMNEQFFGMLQNSDEGLGAAARFVEIIEGAEIPVSKMSDEIQNMYAAALSMLNGPVIGGQGVTMPVFKDFKGVGSEQPQAEPDAGASKDAATTVAEKYTEIGRYAGEGFLTGLQDAVGQWWDGIWQGFINSAKAKLGIQSPSRVFKEIGEDVIAGFAEGLAAIPANLWDRLWDTLPTPAKMLREVRESFSSAMDWLEGLGGEEGLLPKIMKPAWLTIPDSFPSVEEMKTTVTKPFADKGGIFEYLRSLGGKEGLLFQNMPSVEDIVESFRNIPQAFKDTFLNIFRGWNAIDLSPRFKSNEQKGLGAFEFPGWTVAGKEILPKATFGGVTFPSFNLSYPDLVPNIPLPEFNFATGGIATRQMNALIGEAGYPEAVIPLNQRGAEVLAATMARYVDKGDVQAAGMERYASPVTNYYSTTQDYSTQFNGPVTVKAQNPDELAQKLAARARRQALAQPIRGQR